MEEIFINGNAEENQVEISGTILSLKTLGDILTQTTTTTLNLQTCSDKFDKDLNMEIKNRDDFLIFLQNFINETDAGEYENNTLSGFLEAMRYWIKDMDGYYKNVGKEENFDENIKWSVLADIFEAARIYE